MDGGEIGAGHTVTALYEVTLPEDGDVAAGAPLATVDLRWTDPDSGEAVERSATRSPGILARADTAVTGWTTTRPAAYP